MNVTKNKSIRKGFILLKTILPAIGALLLAAQTGCNGLGKRLGMVTDSDVAALTAALTKTIDNKFSILENKLNAIAHKIDTLQKDVDIIKNQSSVPPGDTILNANAHSASGSSSNSSPDSLPSRRNTTRNENCDDLSHRVALFDIITRKV